ncbi:MAG TPA: ligase-associated DNA damage response DEXH box helicase [Gemmatimonadaceae bacterium]|nr:ligase-associated DNA damage response DEXH box helicase [Gemmatimonadaceae bacterium]
MSTSTTVRAAPEMPTREDNIARVERWFASHRWTPFPFQREVWRAYLAGESGLVHAATGTGKTLAIWMAPIIEALGEPRRPSPLRVLWITPLRALAADTAEALAQSAHELELGWTIETRTSDTPSAVRARQSRRLPTALLTTPESLSLLLSRDEAGEQFESLRLVVVDEWHELMGTKRGVQVELVLARLRQLRPDARIWGLSATIGNLDDARHALLGNEARASRVVRGVEPKRVVVDALIPPVVERFPWAGHLGTQMLPAVVNAIEEGESAIVFTNTRSQTEIWYRALLEARPDWAGVIALHHGSLERRTREWVEDGLRTGRLRCVIATSSLDLGVDFSPVDRVLQIGSPKGVARLLQRAGRSGHRPGALSRVTCIPTNVLELIDVAAARDGIETGAIESRLPVERPLDLLVQHVVTVALGGGFVAEEMLREVRTTRAYAELTDAEWNWVMDFIARGGDALQGYEDYARVVQRNGRWVVANREIARRHRMSIGTIVGDAQITVQYLRGQRLGSVEESFIARLRAGDRFTFAGKPLEFVRVRDMRAWVRRAPNGQGVIPRWMGSRLPLSRELAAAIRRRLDEAHRGIFRGEEMEALRPILEVQARWSRVPALDELLIERVRTREGHHLFIFPFEGRLVHEGIAALLAYRLSRLAPISFTLAANDYGVELLSAEPAPLEEALEHGLLSPHDLVEDLPAALNASEMAKRQFREIARIAGLVFPGFPRSGKTARQLQASSGLFFDVLERYDPSNLLLSQARREVLERQLERSRLGRTLERLTTARVVITTPRRTPPLAFPLLVDRARDRVSSETLADRIRRMQLSLERAAG